MASTSSPPWDSLPLELYVLFTWELSSIADPVARRKELVQSFVQLGHTGRDDQLTLATAKDAHEHMPPRAEWAKILEPLRTAGQRRLAVLSEFPYDEFGTVWLRTAYGPGTDEAHKSLLSRVNIDIAINTSVNILDDKDLYDFGSDWNKIFEIIPERLFCFSKNPCSIPDNPHDKGPRIQSLSESSGGATPSNFDLDEYREKTLWHHIYAIANHLWLADSIALATGMVGLVFFDEFGRLIRLGRIDPQHCEGMTGAIPERILDEQEEFTDADIGPDYLPGGICGLNEQSSHL